MIGTVIGTVTAHASTTRRYCKPDVNRSVVGGNLVYRVNGGG